MDTAYTLDHQPPSEEPYVFRVIAINKAGKSKPSDESDFLHLRKIVVQEAPTIQEKLSDVFIARKTTLVLTCIISGTPEPDIEWYHENIRVDNTYTTTYHKGVAKLVIESTTETTAGAYKCVARNVCGNAESSCMVAIRELPSVHVEEHFLSKKLRIDDQYEVSATVTGYPRPKVVWFKSKTKLEAKANTKMTYEEEISYLSIGKLKRSHTGKYVIEASNEHGSSRQELNLTIIDKPSPPEGPLIVTSVKKDSVQLEWKPPRDCGGLELTQYIIEKYSLDQKTWIKVAEVLNDTLTYNVQKLKANAQYQFRVTACNTIGESEPLESDVFTMRITAEKPSPPRGPVQASGMTKDSFVVSWEKSETDGGSAITNYIIDIKKSTEKQWSQYGTTTSEVTHLLLKDLSQSTGYDIRICARNNVGDSLYLESEESIVTGRQPSKSMFRFAQMISQLNCAFAAPNTIAFQTGLLHIRRCKYRIAHLWCAKLSPGH